MTTGITRGDIDTFAASYNTTAGGVNALSRNVDASQYAAAIQMIQTATDNMHRQFSSYLKVFEDLA